MKDNNSIVIKQDRVETSLNLLWFFLQSAVSSKRTEQFS